MKQRKWIFAILVLALVLAGCSGEAADTPAEEPVEEAAALPVEVTVDPSAPVEAAECVVVPPQDFTDRPAIPTVVEGEFVYGNPDAAVSIIEYSELQCPYCSQFEPIITEFAEEYGDEVRVVFRHFPLTSIHDKAMLGAQAMEAARMQEEGKFNEIKNVLFEKQEEWSALTVEEFQALVIEEAEALGLDVDQFETDLLGEDTIAIVENQRDQALEIGISGTPTVIIDGFFYAGARDPESMYAMVEALAAAKEEYGEEFVSELPIVELAVPEDIEALIAKMEELRAEYGDKLDNYPLSVAGSPDFFDLVIKIIDLQENMYTECPEMTIDRDKQYIATLETSKGDVVIELYPDKAPTTVNSFVFLANDGWFDNIPFHRVIPGFVAQTGDPSGSGIGSPGYAFGNEINDLLYDAPGLVGMANSGPDSNGSQFFITYDALPQLDGGYTIFGEVIEGLENVEALTAVDPQSGITDEPDTLISVTIEEK